MKEIWKDIDFTDGLYQVSNYGKIRKSFHKEWKITNNKQNPKKRANTLLAYMTFCYNKRTYSVHRIVAVAFIPNPDNKPEVNHIDFNTLNNRVDNLEWVTSKENKIHSKENYSKCKLGEKHPLATITDNIAFKIKKDRKKGMKYKQLMIKYKLPQHTIANVCTRYFKHLDKKTAE